MTPRDTKLPDADIDAGGPVRRKRGVGRRIAKVCAWLVGGVVLLVLIALGGLAWYSTTEDFHHRVSKEVVSVLEDATGGRVELKRMNFSLRRLAIEVEGLVIHGTEAADQPPYVAVDKITVRLTISSFFSHTAGTGIASHIALNLLRVEHPQIHLIIDKDGKTNQPTPKHPSTSKEPLSDTLLDLKAHEVEIQNGVALLNDRAIPLDVAARELEAEVHYIPKTDRYGATVDLNDLTTKMSKYPEVQSKLHAEAELGRDAVELKRLDYTTGKATVVKASATLNHFAQPEWQAALDGSLEIKQVGLLAGVDGLTGGVLDLNLRGHNCTVAPAAAQKRAPFWRRRHPQQETKPSMKVLPPDPDCKAGYLLVGEMKVHKAGYEDEDVRVHDVDAAAHLKITPTDLLFNALSGTLPGGGGADGDLRIENWLGEVGSDTAVKGLSNSPTVVAAAKTANKTAAMLHAPQPVKGSMAISQGGRAHAYLTMTTKAIPLRTIMDVVAPKNYGDLGFDTSVSGPVKVEWGGPAADIASSVQVDGNLTFAPTGVKRKGALSDIPVTGQAVAHYDGKTEVVRIERVQALTPESTLEASGVLGVNKGDPLTALRVDLTVRDLGEYDQLLQTLGFEANGKKGSAAIPVVLHGTMGFTGTASGPIADLDVKGHLQATQVEVKLGAGTTQQADVQVDSVIADAEFAPYTGLAVASSTIKRGTAVLNVGGTAKPHKVTKRKTATYVWDDDTAVGATVQLANAQVADVLQIAGQQNKYPVTGTLNLHGKVNGTLGALSGGGNISLANGVAYGEGFQAVNLDLSVQGKEIEAKNVLLRLHDMQIAGDGGYNLASEQFHGHVQGNNLVLSKFDTVKKSGVAADGTVSLNADANGTIEQPGLKASVKLANVSANGHPVGDATVGLRSEGKVLYLTAHSTLVGAKLEATGQAELTGSYQTQAKLTIAGLDVGKSIDLFAPGSIHASSAIDGVVTVNGPLTTPKSLQGNLALNNVDFKVEGLEFKAAEAVRASLSDGVATLDELHITGVDTDLRASGTAQVFGATDPKGGRLAIRGTGSVSPAIAHVFDKEVQASGKVSFDVTAGGRVKQPQLEGMVKFEHVNANMESIPNGVTDMNGTLQFNEDRLQVQSLVATTGGGKLSIGGYFSYRNGLYADLTATADTVRVRYNGLSSTANANLKLQGGPTSLQLAGSVLITRFGVGADVDFAAFAGTGGVAAPPEPGSITDNIRLDVHVMSSPQLDFQNSYAKLAGTVDLTVRGTVAAPTVLGRIQITDGSATFAGTTYQLQRGNIYFSNPVRIDPVIDLDATARVENYDITIGLHGTSTNLKPTYRSEPPLSEADVFNLLALGRTQEEAQLYQEQQVQQGTDPTTSALLGGALNATVSSRAQKLFGVGSVKIDPAFVGTLGNSSARITVQQQLTQQLTLTFATNVNESAQQLIQVQYQLNHTTSIVATRDETGVFSVVYKIRKRYR